MEKWDFLGKMPEKVNCIIFNGGLTFSRYEDADGTGTSIR